MYFRLVFIGLLVLIDPSQICNACSIYLLVVFINTHTKLCCKRCFIFVDAADVSGGDDIRFERT